MALETGTYISDLTVTNPVAGDPKSQGDDHLRLLKTALRNSFPGFTGPVVVGGTTAGSVNAYTLTPATAMPAWVEGTVVVCEFHLANTTTTPTLNISGLGAKTIVSCAGAALAASDLLLNRYTALLYDGTNLQLLAVTKNYVDQLAFSSALPAQTGNGGKLVTTDGSIASWLAQATQSEAEAGTISTAWVSPLRVAQAIAALATPSITRSPRTSNTILAAADRGDLIDATSGTYSQTLTAAATLGDGWYAYVGNSGTGFVTLDPNGAETITVNGTALSTWVLWPGEMGLLVCNGTGFFYYCIQKGKITQTIGVAVSSVAFTTGIIYRRRMSLYCTNVVFSSTPNVSITLKAGTTPSRRGYLAVATTTVSGSNANGEQLTPAAAAAASTTGAGSFSSTTELYVGPIDTTTVSHVDYTAGGPESRSVIIKQKWVGTGETDIGDITLAVTAGTMTEGTFTLTEL